MRSGGEGRPLAVRGGLPKVSEERQYARGSALPVVKMGTLSENVQPGLRSLHEYVRPSDVMHGASPCPAQQ